ncbi:MAG: OmpA family protein, partial [Lewinella sp.]|nr:OmpA family protein [Lewinella sp.]
MNAIRCFFLSSLFTALALPFAWAQEGVIYLNNPSFEDMPRHSHPPRGWSDCGFPGESPPDIQPDYTFQVSWPPAHGSTYLGMVVRDNDTWERVSQALSAPMETGTCYQFSLQMARSNTYVSYSRETGAIANYITPAKLRVWGGFGACDRGELLAESRLVTENAWLEYSFKLEPNANYTHIVLEAFYQTPTLFPYNGNLLLDNCSALMPIPCDEDIADAPHSEPSVVQQEPDTPATTPVRPQRPDPTPEAAPVRSSEPETIFGVGRSQLREGMTVPIDRIQFEANSAQLLTTSREALEELHDFLAQNPDVIVEIGGHTNGLADSDY